MSECKGRTIASGQVHQKQLAEDVRHALYAAKVQSYAQGMNLLRAASGQHSWGLRLGAIARIWKGGCIIRARFLDTIRKAYGRTPELSNLLLDPELQQSVVSRQATWRSLVGLAQQRGIPVAGLASGLAYFDAFRTADLPQNLTQAQRDAFGAHTYQRKGDPNAPFVHSAWLESRPA